MLLLSARTVRLVLSQCTTCPTPVSFTRPRSTPRSLDAVFHNVSSPRNGRSTQVAWLLSGVYFGLVPAGPLLFGRSDEASALVFGERHPYSVHKGAAFASVVHSCYDYEAVV